MSSLITISTRELQAVDPNLNPSDFICNFPTPIELGSLDYEVALYKFVGWNTVRNITSSKNIRYSIDAVNYTLVIAPGLYGVEDLNAFLQTDVVANGGVIDKLSLIPNYSTNRARVVIDNSGAHTYTMDLTYTSNLSTFLGFVPAVISSTTEGTILPNVNNGVDSFILQTDLQRNSYNNGRVSNILYSFVPSYSPSSQIIEAPTNLVYFQVNKQTINSIKILLTDNSGNTLNFAGENLVIQLVIRKIANK